MKRKCVALLSTLFVMLQTFAQQPSSTVEMADTFRSNGKIYVVVAVILTIFIGIILYLVRMDRKLSQLEKQDSLTHRM